jgi:hypothetical protein
MASVLLGHYQTSCSSFGARAQPTLVAQLNQAARSNPDAEEIMLHLAGNQPEMFNSRLRDGDLMPMVEGFLLVPSLTITCLDLSYNELKEYGALTLVRLLTEAAHVLELNIAYNDIGASGCVKIAQALQKHNRTLLGLNLSGNTVGDDGGMAIAEMLTANRTLQVLKLSHTGLGTQSIISLATVLNFNKVLQVLEIENPRLFSLQEESAVHLGRMLRVNDTLLELNLAKHGLRDFGAVELCVGLVANKSLRYLDLRCNKLSVECCAALNDLLTKTSSITSLILSHNALGDAGALVLANGLRSNRTLQNLDMSHCKIKGGGLIALADGIRHQGMLEQLQLWGNEFSVDAAEVLCEKMLPRLQYVPDFACPHQEQISLVMWFPDSRPRSFAARIRLESSQRGAFISQDVCDACAQQRARAMRPCYALAGI